MEDNLEIACEICQKSFTLKKNLIRHYGEFHPGIPLPDYINDIKDKPKTCPSCSKPISKANFQRHFKACRPKVDQQPASSSSHTREVSEVDDTLTLNQSLFGENKRIDMMMREFYSKSIPRDRQHITNYIHALNNFSESFARKTILTPKTLMQAFHSKFADYFDSLQTVFERNTILHGMKASFKMMYDMKLITFVPEIPQLKTSKELIEAYLNSSIRCDYFRNLESHTAAEFSQAVGPLAIRNFLLFEAILATKSSDFVHQLTREMYLKGTPTLDYNNQTKWIFEIGPEQSFELPDFLKARFHSYLAIIRRHVLPRTKMFKDGKLESWDPHGDVEVKFFAVSGKGRYFQVEVSQSVFDMFHKVSQSHTTLHLKDFLGETFDYRPPRAARTSRTAQTISQVSSSLTNQDRTRKRTASNQREYVLEHAIEPVDEPVDEPVLVTNVSPTPTSRKTKHLSFKFTNNDRAFLQQVFKDVGKTELTKVVVLSRRIFDDGFDEFMERQLHNNDISEDKIAEEIVRTLRR